jgi:predicted amidophosphoribosyltransferase
MVWIWLAYLCFVAYTAWCVSRLRKSGAYPYACGACGAKMRTKGVCPHCGAINE